MKKIISLILSLCISYYGFAQNVGIGVVNPTYKLHVGNATDGLRVEGPAISGGNALSIGGLGNVVIDKPGTVGGRFTILENGNTGIGEPNPGFPLNFESILGEKISFYGTNGSNYGIGVQGGLLQIHANVATDDIAFGTGSSASFAENMRIKGNGNVGIGTITPQGYGHGGNNKILEIKNPNSSINSQSQLILSTAAADGSMGGITWAQNNIVTNPMAGFLGCVLDPFNTGSKLVFYTRNTPANLLTEKMTINGNGNVGIGTSSPNALLQLGNTITNRKIVLFDQNNNDNQYYGFGINGGVLRYQVSNTVSDHVFYAGTSATASTELLRIKGNGALAVGGSTGTSKQILTSNGNGMAPVWTAANSIINYGSSGITNSGNGGIFGFFLVGDTEYDLPNSAISLNLSVTSRIVITYKCVTYKNCVIGNCATKWRLIVNVDGVFEEAYFLDGQAYSGGGGASSNTVGPNYFDLSAGSHTITFKALNLFNNPEIKYQAMYTIVPL
jgi:hypothetical protein